MSYNIRCYPELVHRKNVLKNFFRKIAKNHKICAEKNGNYWIKNHVDSTRYKIIFIPELYEQNFEANFSTLQNRCKPQ